MAFFFNPMSLGIPVDPPFAFRQRYGKVNWRLVQQVDLDSAVQLGDVQKLNEVKETLTFSQFEQDDLERYPDALLVKAFRLLQLLLEHADYHISKATLVTDLSGQELKSANETIAELQAKVRSLEEELTATSKELKNKAHILSTYEYLLRQPSTAGLVNQMLTQHNAVQCQYCSKLFMSNTYLEQHIAKRHSLVSQSVKDESKASERAKQLETTLESMKVLMTKNIQAINEGHAKQIEAIQSTFQRKLEQMQEAQMELEKVVSRPATAETDVHASDYALREVLHAQQDFRRAMEERDMSMKEHLKLIEERQKKLVLEGRKAQESFEVRVEEVIKKQMEQLPKLQTQKDEGAQAQLLKSDDGSSQNEELEEKVKSNAGEVESDEASGQFSISDEQSEAKTVKRAVQRPNRVEASNPYELGSTVAAFKPDLTVVEEQPEDRDIEIAAAELGVPKTEAKQVQFVLKAYARAKEGSPWTQKVAGGKMVYENVKTGEILGEHPDCKRFQQSLQRAQLLSQRVNYSSFLSLQAMTVTQTPNSRDGISTLFNHKHESFKKSRSETQRKVSSSMARLKDRVSESLTDLQERQKERVQSEPAYRKYYEEVTAEADMMLTKALARRSLVEPAKTIFGKIHEKKFAEDAVKKMLRVDERDSRMGRDSL